MLAHNKLTFYTKNAKCNWFSHTGGVETRLGSITAADGAQCCSVFSEIPLFFYYYSFG